MTERGTVSDKGMVMEAVNGIIGKLVSLQAVLKEMYDIEQVNKRLPLTVAEMRKQIEPWEIEIESCRREIVEGKANIRAIEAEIQVQEDRLTQIIKRAQLVNKTKELEAVELEQQTATSQIQNLKQQGRDLKTRIEANEKRLAELEPEYQAHEEKIGVEETRINGEIEVNAGRIAVLRGQREEMIVGIDLPTLARFERILNSKNGIGIVPIVSNSCDGCHMRVPPQMVGEIKRGGKLVTCLNCSRILYVTPQG